MKPATLGLNLGIDKTGKQIFIDQMVVWWFALLVLRETGQ